MVNAQKSTIFRVKQVQNLSLQAYGSFAGRKRPRVLDGQRRLNNNKTYSIMRNPLVLSLCLFSAITVYGQSGRFVPDDGITTPHHQANIGNITFMSKPIPADQYKESDFLQAFEWCDSCDLNIRVFMAQSLTNYLHILAPDWTAEALTQKGNYQVSFFIDETLEFVENLNPRAGSAAGKNKSTVFRVPLKSTTNEDSWGRFLWSRFMMNGGEDALTEGTHTLKIEIRPYLIMGEVRTGDLIAQGQLKLIVVKPAVTEADIAVQPILTGSDWPVAQTTCDQEKIRALNKGIAQRTFKDITSIAVIRDGKLLVEEYFNGATRNTLHDTRSVGKSFTSALMGIAIREGHISNENQPLSRFYDLRKFARYDTRKAGVTIRDLLKMSSAFNGSDADQDSPGNEENMYPTPDWVKFTLDLPMDSTKTNGKQWDYFTAGVILLGDILHQSVPGGLEKYAAQKLFQPLNIRQYQWQYTPQQVANTAGGLKMTTLDYAKFGQLYQNKGQWNGQQIIPAAWVDRTFTRHLEIPDRTDEYYGYLFWNKTYTVNGKPFEAYYCTGNGGSKIFVFKDLPLTIVITAKAYNKPFAHLQVDKMMERYILPAVVR
jgi:CubicO group peptidase (beta-lactamase class C family)